MTKYKFQFKTGHIYDGPVEIEVKDFVAEVKYVNPALALVIEARGGQLVEEEKPKAKPKKRKITPVKWPVQDGEK